MILFPNVKSRIETKGYFDMKQPLNIVLTKELSRLKNILNAVDCDLKPVLKNGNVNFIANPSLKSEEYILEIASKAISIEYSDYNGALYGLVTLRQLIAGSLMKMKNARIHDYPDLKVRGVMIDISRDKIPTLKTLEMLADQLMGMKINHLELYVEGFSIEYPAFPLVTAGETPFKLSDYVLFERYCLTRGIDLVGNMNGFGHMSAWLERPEFHDLAECPDGFVQWGFPFPASTLNPLDENSFELVKKTYEGFLPKSKSHFFNINCDEPFELGRGRSASRCLEIGLENVYVDFVNRLVDLIHESGKTPMLWGDVLIHHPEAAKRLSKDLIFIDWGYDRDYSFEAHAKIISELKLPFILAPGTSTWNSFTSRYEDMRITTLNAATACKNHGGLGILTTDWGDNGHLQYLPWSYLGFAFAAKVSWSVNETDQSSMDEYLNRFVFQDRSNRLAGIMTEVAHYNDLETTYVHNATMAFQSILYVDPSNRFPFEMVKTVHQTQLKNNPLSLENHADIERLLNDALSRLNAIEAIDPLLKAEIAQGIQFVRFGADVNLFINGKCVDEVSELIKRLDDLMALHSKLWLKRNKKGGLNRSLSRLVMLKSLLESHVS
jgi:hexosaminidase